MSAVNRALGTLGLCARARKLACGAQPAVNAVRSGRAWLVVLDTSAGPNTRKMVENACRHHGVRLCLADGLGRAVGKYGRMAVAVLDEGMARRIIELFDRESG